MDRWIEGKECQRDSETERLAEEKGGTFQGGLTSHFCVAANYAWMTCIINISNPRRWCKQQT